MSIKHLINGVNQVPAIIIFLTCQLVTPSLSSQTGALLTAIKTNNLSAANKILDAGSPVNDADNEGDPVLMNATLYSSVELMELLLKKGANPNAKNKDGETSLMWAVNDIDKVKVLVEHGALINARATSGNTPLLIACVGSNQYTVVKHLLDHGADPSVKNARRETALMRAAYFGDTAILSLLLHSGIDINAMDSTGATALLNALFHVNRRATIWLLDRGADANMVAAYGLTALAAVVTYNDLPSVKAVLQKTANINAVDATGNSVLMWAAYNENDNTEIIQALLDRGADVNLKAKNGDTALSWALKKGNTKTVAILKKAGAR